MFCLTYVTSTTGIVTISVSPTLPLHKWERACLRVWIGHTGQRVSVNYGSENLLNEIESITHTAFAWRTPQNMWKDANLTKVQHFCFRRFQRPKGNKQVEVEFAWLFLFSTYLAERCLFCWRQSNAPEWTHFFILVKVSLCDWQFPIEPNQSVGHQ